MLDPNVSAAVIVNQINGILAKDNWKDYMDWLRILRQDVKACQAAGATKEGVLVALNKIKEAA